MKIDDGELSSYAYFRQSHIDCQNATKSTFGNMLRALHECISMYTKVYITV
jgi:hypothetical protein